ncbi:chemotaxis protein CheW [Candidatus Nitrospira bockiana]
MVGERDRTTTAVQTDEGERNDRECRQLVTCCLDEEEFAVDILSVQEINRMVEITRVPKAPAFVEGVINLRGRIIPVLNLRRRFGMAEASRTARSRIVVVNVKGRTVGLIVDSVSEVLQISKDAIEPPPSLETAIGAEFIQGVGRIKDRLLILIDLHNLLTPGEHGALEALKA